MQRNYLGSSPEKITLVNRWHIFEKHKKRVIIYFMSEQLRLYPKTLRDVGTVPEQIADQASYMALSTGVLKGMHAANNQSQNRCINDTPISECEATRESTVEAAKRVPHDSNDGFTGWVGYEPASVECGECGNICKTHIFWQDGEPTEEARTEYYPKVEYDTVITINIK